MADLTHLLQTNTYHSFASIDYFHFYIIGAGGTGGYLIPNFVRQLSLANKKQLETGYPTHKLTIFDSDVIEPKNLIRQNFVQSDIGKNKAEVMARRYGGAFQQEVSFVPEYITSPKMLLEIIDMDLESEGSYWNKGIVLIDCTDNTKTRLILSEVHKVTDASVSIYLSSGNEETSGQVISSFSWDEEYYCGSVQRRNAGIKQQVTGRDTPDFFDVFPNASIDRLPSELSCAEQAVSAPQNIATNITAANILFGLLNKILNDIPINELAVFFDSQTLGQTIYRSNYEDMKKLLSLTPNNPAKAIFLEKSDADDNPVEKITWKKAQDDYLKQKEEERQQKQEQLSSILAGEG